jgi:hypothetical protein
LKKQIPISRFTHPVEISGHTELAATLKPFIESGLSQMAPLIKIPGGTFS